MTMKQSTLFQMSQSIALTGVTTTRNFSLSTLSNFTKVISFLPFIFEYNVECSYICKNCDKFFSNMPGSNRSFENRNSSIPYSSSFGSSSIPYSSSFGSSNIPYSSSFGSSKIPYSSSFGAVIFHIPVHLRAVIFHIPVHLGAAVFHIPVHLRAVIFHIPVHLGAVIF